MSNNKAHSSLAGISVFAPANSGPCTKQTVTATIIAKSGKRYVSTNFCSTPQATCPRGSLPSGVGYELCKSVCNQPAHAEVNAVAFAGDEAIGATLYLEGHTYACDNCKRVCKDAGIVEIFIQAPPLAA